VLREQKAEGSETIRWPEIQDVKTEDDLREAIKNVKRNIKRRKTTGSK